MPAVVGFVHGGLAAEFDLLDVKLALGAAGAVVMVISGGTSARQTLPGALGIGVAMGLLSS